MCLYGQPYMNATGLRPPRGGGGSRQQRCSKVEQLKLLRRRAKGVAKCMGELGLCVVDDFLGADAARALLQDAERMRLGGEAGGEAAATEERPSQLRRPSDEGRPRGCVTRQWIAEGDAPCAAAAELLRRADSLMQACDRRLGPHVVSGRTKAMLVRYPEHDAVQSPRVDNSRNDSRCLTCIYYLTDDWDRARDGGQMKVFTAQSQRVATVDPLFDRLLLFWSDGRSVRQLLPSSTARQTVEFWYLTSPTGTSPTGTSPTGTSPTGTAAARADEPVHVHGRPSSAPDGAESTTMDAELQT